MVSCRGGGEKEDDDDDHHGGGGGGGGGAFFSSPLTLNNYDTSSAETLIYRTTTPNNNNYNNNDYSSNMASSSETLNNDYDDDYDNPQHSDGWLTVKCRSRFKQNNNNNNNMMRFKQNASNVTPTNWSNRYHQVSATASLPALALLPEYADDVIAASKKSTPANIKKTLLSSSSIIDKKVKENLNTFKSLRKSINNTTIANKMLLKRSHTTLSSYSSNSNNNTTTPSGSSNNARRHQQQQEQHLKKSVVDREERRMNAATTTSAAIAAAVDIDSETDDEISKFKDMQEDFATEEAHRRKAKQLSEEEDRLNKEIEQLQCLEIEVDTETDGTETDGELTGDNYDGTSNALVYGEEYAMSLEARYEPMLAGKIIHILCVSILLV